MAWDGAIFQLARKHVMTSVWYVACSPRLNALSVLNPWQTDMNIKGNSMGKCRWDVSYFLFRFQLPAGLWSAESECTEDSVCGLSSPVWQYYRHCIIQVQHAGVLQHLHLLILIIFPAWASTLPFLVLCFVLLISSLLLEDCSLFMS